jgi:hypothetical protein
LFANRVAAVGDQLGCQLGMSKSGVTPQEPAFSLLLMPGLNNSSIRTQVFISKRNIRAQLVQETALTRKSRVEPRGRWVAAD